MSLIRQYLLPDDMRFLRLQLSRQPSALHHSIKMEYKAQFLKAWNAEPAPHKKANCGRFAANAWLVEQFGPLSSVTGWVAMPVSQADIAAAKKRHKDSKNGIAPYAQWEGQLGELIFDRWLQQQSADYQWNNSDGEAFGWDFIVNSIAVDMKTSGRKMKPQKHWTVGVEEKKAQAGAHHYFFSIYQRDPGDTLWLLGGLSSRDFMQFGQLDLEGDQKHAAFTVRRRGSMYNVDVLCIDTPDEWLHITSDAKPYN